MADTMCPTIEDSIQEEEEKELEEESEDANSVGTDRTDSG